jgi:hypothetical protein
MVEIEREEDGLKEVYCGRETEWSLNPTKIGERRGK